MSDSYFKCDCVSWLCSKLRKIRFNNQLLDDRTEQLVALTAGRHKVDLVIMVELVGEVPLLFQECLYHRWFSFAVFLMKLIWSHCLDLLQLWDFLHADYGILGDSTETWITQSENFEPNNATVSYYKNRTTVKVVVWNSLVVLYANVLMFFQVRWTTY